MARMNGLAYLGLGAALMYLFDPQLGRKRRIDLRNQADSARRKVQHGSDAVLRDATNRTHGMLVETRHWLQSQRQRLERRSADAANEAGTIADEAASRARSAIAPWRKTRWSPAQRALAGIAGAGLATSGYVRGGVLGVAMAITGVGLIARAAGNEELGSLAKGKGFRVDRTIVVDAPVARVFAYWRDFRNFPRWMSHVREVRSLGADRYHWVVDGPAGVPVEWDSRLTAERDDRELAWQSVEGSTVENGGRVRFEPEGENATRVHVELTYAPPGGVLGQAVARAFGMDPGSEMDDDLGKLKAQIEGDGGGAMPPQKRGDTGLGTFPA